jgi:hypothetical protein
MTWPGFPTLAVNSTSIIFTAAAAVTEVSAWHSCVLAICTAVLLKALDTVIALVFVRGDCASTPFPPHCARVASHCFHLPFTPGTAPVSRSIASMSTSCFRLTLPAYSVPHPGTGYITYPSPGYLVVKVPGTGYITYPSPGYLVVKVPGASCTWDNNAVAAANPNILYSKHTNTWVRALPLLKRLLRSGRTSQPPA